MNVAFIYSSQGSQAIGMGADLYRGYPVFAAAMSAADPSGDIRGLCFHGTAEQLSDTRNTQPCMVACAVATTTLLSSVGIVPTMVAGLSLGEYSALCAAGVFGPRQAVELAAFRGRAMAEAVVDRDCGMAAVLGLDRETLGKVCEEASARGIVEPTNYNCPGQIVISGDLLAVNKACELALEAGARRCLPLPVSGPFHTSLMKPAGDALHERLVETEFGEMDIPVVFNTTAHTIREGETVPELLERQVQHSVYFEDSIRFMCEQGIDTFIEIGPDRTLSGFVRKTAPECVTMNVNDAASFQKTVSVWEEAHDVR